MLGEMF